MITFLNAKDFKAVHWLETSQLMQNHPQGIHFSIDKPNVIVGPNGAGKSALLMALSMRTLTYYEDESRFDSHYTSGLHGADKFFTREDRRSGRYTFLQGLTTISDLAPAMFYRPNRIPGNEDTIASSMMTGYFDEAKAYARLTEKKSSGQKSIAVMDRLLSVLSGAERPTYVGGIKRKKKRVDPALYIGEGAYIENAFIDAYKNATDDGTPLVIMDEPEQSLDALAELQLWLAIEKAKTQVIVATHSLYPFLQPEKFNIIEAVPNYCAVVQSALNSVVGPA